jgi:replication initiation protein RepC
LSSENVVSANAFSLPEEGQNRMQTNPLLPLAPHGPGKLSRGMVDHNIKAKACLAGASVHKWTVLKSIKVAAKRLGVSLRRVGLLEGLLSFHPSDELVAGQNLIVFASNRTLARRANMSQSSVTRGLLDLGLVGLILRRDSPNGKRFARKGQGGALHAFGLDLTPLISRAREFEQLAAQIEQEQEELRHLRQAISIHQRDIRKMMEMAIDDEIPGDWSAFEIAFAPCSARISRSIGLAEAAVLTNTLDRLVTGIRNHLESHIETSNLTSTAAQTEHHIQDQNKNNILESEAGQPIGQGATEPPLTPKPNPPADYAQGGVRDQITSWRDLMATAAHVRPMLGISSSAWEVANQVLGPQKAAILIAAIVQRTAAINSPGGYLRSLTEKARAGTFSLRPVLSALISKNLREFEARLTSVPDAGSTAIARSSGPIEGVFRSRRALRC